MDRWSHSGVHEQQVFFFFFKGRDISNVVKIIRSNVHPCYWLQKTSLQFWYFTCSTLPIILNVKYTVGTDKSLYITPSAYQPTSLSIH